ncbi:MAG: glycoside hydrolase family protein [Bacteroidaceae bacterium]|nr:glycoside hydrolase family protein [Bacteroidaceae bacterium]
MNLRNYVLALMLSTGLIASAANTTTTVDQVTGSVTLTDDVDYVITSTTPFTTTGSVNITNTDHAVVIISNIKPSKVISNWLSFIYINGEKAVSDKNCQVKMYNKGAIIFPYSSDIQPLTCYTEKNFEGESCSDYSEGHSGGYMKTLNAKTLNNNFKSFKLKRGYMVTFALGTSGWGYSRCFIADHEDLEINLPVNMCGKVSSYRIFKWQNAKKAGLASDTGYSSTQAVNASWCYSWGNGENRYPDTECVPNHIYEDWPSSSSCGSVTYSCHMKTNNEPGNSADDTPQTVDQVLANWQNLMRTGMRLCSESSHDGSMSHLKSFIDSIDARGWRCDLLDLHCYWAAGTFNNLNWYSSNYGNGRPIWISEWVWGASWNNNGIFGAVSDRGDYSTSTQQKCYDGTKPILDVLNSSDIVERYAYWNSEAACSKIYKDGSLSILGKYYATMDDGLGYKASKQFIPKVVYKAATSLSGTYKTTTNSYNLTWCNPNGDMIDSMVVELMAPNTVIYKKIATVMPTDQSSSTGSNHSYAYEMTEPGLYTFRIASYPAGNKTAKYSGTIAYSISDVKGTADVQYGNIDIINTDEVTTNFNETLNATPSIFMGACSYNNTKLFPGNYISTASKRLFKYKLMPWTCQDGCITSPTKTESIPFLAIPSGNYTLGDLDVEVGNVKPNTRDTLEVKFNKPFPEGVTPVVITEVFAQTNKNYATISQIWDVTNEGFKCFVTYEATLLADGTVRPSILSQSLNYLAMTPGFAALDADNGILIAAGTGTTSSILAQKIDLLNGEEQLSLNKPYVFAKCQTKNYPAGAILRLSRTTEDDNDMTTAIYIKRQVDEDYETSLRISSKNPDTIGWVIIAETADNSSIPTNINSIVKDGTDGMLMTSVENRVIRVINADEYEVFSITGAKVNAKAQQAPGIYVVKSGNKSAKVIVE